MNSSEGIFYSDATFSINHYIMKSYAGEVTKNHLGLSVADCRAFSNNS